MAIEEPRLCGFRKVGALYLCGKGHKVSCDRLPYELIVCPVCGEGVKFSRGFRWLDWSQYADNHGKECICPSMHGVPCPICQPGAFSQPYCLLWVGEQYYTMEEFIMEAHSMGVSKRIPQVPRNLKLGVTWSLIAHVSACGKRQEQQDDGTTKTIGIPGVFYVFRPSRVEMLIWKYHATTEKIEELKRRHVTPIIVPDGDTDHDPDTSKIPDTKVINQARNKAFFDNLRSRFGG